MGSMSPGGSGADDNPLTVTEEEEADSQHCDTLTVSNAHLNVTSIALDEWRAWRRAENNATIFSTILATQGVRHWEEAGRMGHDSERDEDYLLFNRIGNFFGSMVSSSSQSKPSKALICGLLVVWSLLVHSSFIEATLMVVWNHWPNWSVVATTAAGPMVNRKWLKYLSWKKGRMLGEKRQFITSQNHESSLIEVGENGERTLKLLIAHSKMKL